MWSGRESQAAQRQLLGRCRVDIEAAQFSSRARARIGCPECDLLGDMPELAPGQRVICGRCGCVLSVCRWDPYGRTVSFSVASFVMLAVALSYPFLSINASGVTNSMTLLQTVSYLASYGADTIAVLVFIFVIFLPALMLVMMFVLALNLRQRRFPAILLAPSRWLFHLNAWAMVEVFSIGVIVSLVKLSAMARVEIGISFWAYLAFSLLFLMAFSSLDRWTVWRSIEQIRG